MLMVEIFISPHLKKNWFFVFLFLLQLKGRDKLHGWSYSVLEYLNFWSYWLVSLWNFSESWQLVIGDDFSKPFIPALYLKNSNKRQPFVFSYNLLLVPIFENIYHFVKITGFFSLSQSIRYFGYSKICTHCFICTEGVRPIYQKISHHSNWYTKSDTEPPKI